MTNIHINTKDQKIEMTKKFAENARCFGTLEYRQLQEVRHDYPMFTESIKYASRKKRDSFKGLTYEFMESYIEKHDEDGSIMEMFKDFRAQSDEAIAFGAKSMSYGEIKSWFFKQYPEIAAYQQKREALLRAAA